MKLIGNIRLGKDAELRTVGSKNTPVATLFGAYNYGKKGDDGKKPTQWVEASLWGPQAESLQPYLLKGEQFLVTLTDVNVVTFDKRDGGTGVKLVGTVMNGGIDFVGGSAKREDKPAPRRQAEQSSGGFDDMDDDLPF
jgi:single-strand DNA-binding protein